MDVRYSRVFLKQLSRLPNHIVTLAQTKENTFKLDPFDPRLGTHKLHGKEKEIWAFWITRSYRIKFTFIEKQAVLFLEIGTHEIYK